MLPADFCLESERSGPVLPPSGAQPALPASLQSVSGIPTDLGSDNGRSAQVPPHVSAQPVVPVSLQSVTGSPLAPSANFCLDISASRGDDRCHHLHCSEPIESCCVECLEWLYEDIGAVAQDAG